MQNRVFQSGNVIFEYLDTWEVEKADTFSNPDCIATLSKGENNLLNVVAFPTETNLDSYKEFMEKCIVDDGGVILNSEFIQIASMDAIKLHGNIKTPDITFDIHTYVFIEDGNIYIFELRTADFSSKTIKEYDDLISSFKLE
ncbi:MAG: hypothetical protein IJH63_03940 [Methanobrevibacter sp.]|uniref:Uncharacterized protein n=1 Tax=Methanobrevibacter millerae TaxID=230361 RepID=A0A8T3VKA3_9EURY|nr:hypothetical protein [Methanobrevibacter millerae]MBE6505100.1 hypothetical protein [Methanobrevibacter millerae]MBR0058998.1 hypothetical protein [Methanobrevibacter sp.]MBR0369859.1 hypothetical protein [Methanobrevibacter sp.]